MISAPIRHAIGVFFLILGLTATTQAASFTIQGITSPATLEGYSPAPQTATFTVAQAGTTQDWTAALEGNPAPAWASLSAASGTGAGSLTITFNTASLAPGTYAATLTLTSGGTVSRRPFSLSVHGLNVIRMAADPSRPWVYALHAAPETYANGPGYLIPVNTSTGETGTAIPVGLGATDLAVSIPEEKLYITNWGKSVIQVYDLPTRTLLSPLPSGTDVYRLSAGKAGRLYAAQKASLGKIFILNSATGAQIGNGVSTNRSVGAAEPSGRYYYCASDHVQLRRYEVETDRWNQSGIISYDSTSASAWDLLASPEGGRVFWARKVFDSELKTLRFLDRDIYSISRKGELAVGDHEILNATNGAVLASLPVGSTVSAVAGDQSAVVFFDAEARKIGSMSLQGVITAPGAVAAPVPADGAAGFSPLAQLQWEFVPLAFRYEVFFGQDQAAVNAATTGSPEFKGGTQNNSWAVPPDSVPPGTSLFWRVDAVGLDGSAVRGAVNVFHALPVTVPTAPAAFTVLRGAPVSGGKVPTGGVPGSTWTASSSGTEWLKVTTASGTAGSDIGLELNPGNLAPGEYTGPVTVSCGALTASFTVTLKVEALNLTALKADPARPVLYAFQHSESLQSSLLSISTGDGRIEKVIPLPGTPSAMDLTPDQRFLFVISRDAWEIYRINLADFTLETRPLPPSADPLQEVRSIMQVAAVSESEVFWVDAQFKSRLHELNFATGMEIGPVISISREGGIEGMARNATGSTLVMGNSQGQAWMLETGGSRKLSGPFGKWRNYSGDMPVTVREDDSVFFLGTLKFSFSPPEFLREYPAAVFAATQKHGLLFGIRKGWRENSLKQVWSAPGNPEISVQAVAGDQSAFFYFDPYEDQLVRVPMESLGDVPGPGPEDGEAVSVMPDRLSWTPDPAALRYEVYFGTDPAGVESAAGDSSPFHLGTTTTASLPFSQAFTMAGLWWWRVDIVLPGGTVKGQVWKFSGSLSYLATLPMAETNSKPTALALDDSTLLVGRSPRRDDFPSLEGVVYVFEKVPGQENWSRTGVLRRPSDSISREFGTTVALKGDVAWIGAPQVEAGSQVLEYRRDPVTRQWSPTGRRVASDVAGDQFGGTMAFNGSLLVVGALGSSQVSPPRSGRVEIYDSGSLRKAATLTDPTGFDEYYGSAMAQGNDFVVVRSGRPVESPGSNVLFRSGELDVWKAGSQETWFRSAALTPAASENVRYFGSIPTVAGDTVFAGTYYYDRDLMAKIYPFERGPGGDWTAGAPMEPNISSILPITLAGAGDLLAFGISSNDQGSGGGLMRNVWLHRRIPGRGWIPVAPAVPPSGSALQSMGMGLALSDRYLVAEHRSQGGSVQPGLTVYLHNPGANLAPVPTSAPKPFAEAGSVYDGVLTARDDNPGDVPRFSALEPLPAWLTLTDHANGTAALSGTPPTGSAGVLHLRFAVRDQAGAATTLPFDLTVLPAAGLPAVSPVSVSGGGTVNDGERVELSVADAGAGAVYQWYQGDFTLAGETENRLILERAQASDTGSYHVRVTRGGAWTDSASVSLTVNEKANRFGGDWPVFGASNSHNGSYPAALGRHKFLPAWTVSGAGPRQVSTGAGRIYATSGDSISDARAVTAYDLMTGTPLWTRTLPASYDVGSPTFHRGRLYAQRCGIDYYEPAELLCLDAGTGGLIWKDEFLLQSKRYPWVVATDAAVYGYYVGLQAYDPSGNRLFSAGLAEGTIPMVHEGGLYASGLAFSLLDPNSGWPVYSLEPFDRLSYKLSSPVASGKTAVLLQYEKLQAVDLEKRMSTWSVPGVFGGAPALKNGLVYAIGERWVQSYDAATGELRAGYGIPEGTSLLQGTVNLYQPIVLDDTLLVSSTEYVWIFNLQTGERLQRLSGGGPITYTDGMLLASGPDQTLRAWRVNQPSVLTAPAEPLTATAGLPVEWSVAVADPDGDIPAIRTAGLPAWLRMSGLSETGIVRFTGTAPAGNDGPFVFTVRADDGRSFPSLLEVHGTIGPAGPPPVVTEVADPVWNAETGLWEQTLTVRNPADVGIAGFEIGLTGLPDGTVLHNRSGGAPGGAKVIRALPLAACASAALVLEYQAPADLTDWNIQFVVSPTNPGPAGHESGNAFQIDRAEMSVPGLFLLEFPAEPGELYFIQRLDPNGGWVGVGPRLRAAGTRVQWQDDVAVGTPDGKSRFYRVQRLPQP